MSTPQQSMQATRTVSGRKSMGSLARTLATLATKCPCAQPRPGQCIETNESCLARNACFRDTARIRLRAAASYRMHVLVRDHICAHACKAIRSSIRRAGCAQVANRLESMRPSALATPSGPLVISPCTCGHRTVMRPHLPRMAMVVLWPRLPRALPLVITFLELRPLLGEIARSGYNKSEYFDIYFRRYPHEIM